MRFARPQTRRNLWWPKCASGAQNGANAKTPPEVNAHWVLSIMNDVLHNILRHKSAHLENSVYREGLFLGRFANPRTRSRLFGDGY